MCNWVECTKHLNSRITLMVESCLPMQLMKPIVEDYKEMIFYRKKHQYNSFIRRYQWLNYLLQMAVPFVYNIINEITTISVLILLYSFSFYFFPSFLYLDDSKKAITNEFGFGCIINIVVAQILYSK